MSDQTSIEAAKNGTSKGISMVGAIGIAGVIAISTVANRELDSLQSQITDYVSATGNGEIACEFGGAKISFSGKPVNQIENYIRPAVVNGLKTGACVATLAKGPR